jgi:hypothetical protein
MKTPIWTNVVSKHTSPGAARQRHEAKTLSMTKADRFDCLRTQMAGDRIWIDLCMDVDYEVRDEAVPAYCCFMRISLSEF